MFQNLVDGHKLETLYPDVYINVHEYGMGIDIAKGVFGIYQGASNHEELHNLMKATIMIRRLKKEVLSEICCLVDQHTRLESLGMLAIATMMRHTEDAASKDDVAMEEDDEEENEDYHLIDVEVSIPYSQVGPTKYIDRDKPPITFHYNFLHYSKINIFLRV
ncbi:hypothetical protein Syun_012709 [Stephania yunnanensis]|uniref:Uncharacterized protein n=1 Tax=Stephania yunnanensis TaxID=152371 RepID=A0AAP0K0R5_9MAGN